MTILTNPVALGMRALAASGLFEAELRAAHQEREALIEAIRMIVTQPREMLGKLAQEYVTKWQQFEQHVRSPSLSDQFLAGRVFGEVLLDVLLLLADGAALLQLVAKVPKLANVAAKLGRLAKGLPKSVAETVAQRRLGAGRAASRIGSAAEAGGVEGGAAKAGSRAAESTGGSKAVPAQETPHSDRPGTIAMARRRRRMRILSSAAVRSAW
jgi:hypothetical protein